MSHPESEQDQQPSESADPIFGATETVSPEELARLQSDLATAQKRVDELARAYQAATQDREDFKKRLTREREQLIEVEKGNVALAVVEAVDELDLCLSAASQDTSALAKGVAMIRQSLIAKLNQMGIERLQLIGTKYDPNLAEAADMEVTPEQDQDQEVLAELRGGYRLKNRIIRPARVKVAKYFAPAQA